MDLTFARFIEWAFMGLIAGGIAWSAKILSQISRSINELNKQVAIILEKTAWHEKELEKHGKWLIHIENRLK